MNTGGGAGTTATLASGAGRRGRPRRDLQPRDRRLPDGGEGSGCEHAWPGTAPRRALQGHDLRGAQNCPRRADATKARDAGTPFPFLSMT